MKPFDTDATPDVPFAPLARELHGVDDARLRPATSTTKTTKPATAIAAPRFRKRTAVVAALLVTTAVALLAELALSLALPRSDFLEADLLDHPILGQMVKPGDNGHDALGFRNPRFPAQADIVAIGDSNTYGVNARSHESWPGHLQSILGRTTYNAALGGFGPLHHLYAARDMTPRFAPKVEVVAMYLGNDLVDAYNLAHEKDYWKAYRIGTRPVGVLTEGERVWHEANAKEVNARFMGPVRDWLAMNSMLYSVARHVVLTPAAIAMRQKATTLDDPEMKMPWADPKHPEVKLVFTSKVILGAEDPDVPQIEEGIRISERALGEIVADAKARGVKLVLAFIPTKERAYCGALKQSGAALPASHLRICEVEPATQARLARVAQRSGVPVVDTTPALEAAIERGVKIYPQGVDSHAVSAGYRVMAETIAAVVKPLL
jgi:GDSL-like Lipase/Acylhydrolase family